MKLSLHGKENSGQPTNVLSHSHTCFDSIVVVSNPRNSSKKLPIVQVEAFLPSQSATSFPSPQDFLYVFAPNR